MWCIHIQQIQLYRFLFSDTEEFEDMDIVIPSTDESIHMLPFPQVSVEWYKRQYSLSVKNISRDSLKEPYWSEEGIIKYIN